MKRLLWGLFLLVVTLAIAFPDATRNYTQELLDTGEPKIRSEIRMYRHETGEIINLNMEDYIIGVVAAEMPAEFHPEALKAQAVAARTFILKRLLAGGVANSPHPDADASDDPREGQGWLSREELRERWGIWDYYRHYYKIKRAVEATDGLVVTFEGQLIDPLYHSSCGGDTENSEDVWKFRVPYLRSVACPFGTDPYPNDTHSYALEEIDQALGTSISAVSVAAGDKPEGAGVEILKFTATGRPKLLSFNGREVPATTVRDRLNLRSTNFNFTIENGVMTFQTSGHGHGVGLCQYGAQGFAEHGFDFREILQHYYTGVQVDEF